MNNVSEEKEYELWQDDMCVAGTMGKPETAFKEIMHYAAVYGQDGPVELYEVSRKKLDMTNPLASTASAVPANLKGNTMQRIHDSDSAIESEIQTKGLTAPRITLQHIQSVIQSEYYFTGGNGIFGEVHSRSQAPQFVYEKSLDTLTFCVLVLKNGFTVTGESACAVPENFDAEIGRKTARENAVNKIWLLEGYLLKQKLFDYAESQAQITT